VLVNKENNFYVPGCIVTIMLLLPRSVHRSVILLNKWWQFILSLVERSHSCTVTILCGPNLAFRIGVHVEFYEAV